VRLFADPGAISVLGRRYKAAGLAYYFAMDSQVITQIVDLAFQILSPVVLALGGYLAHRAIKAFEAKTKLDLPSKQEDMVDTWIADGIRYAEEKAHQAAKRKDADLSGHEKLEAAAGYALDMAKKAGWIDWTRDLLKAKIEAKVNVAKDRPGSPAGQ